ncbi:helix-turn-helix domain-containing protein [Vagococcus hydrophili]|uniref:Helix-turn-helix transcriptional regulator n=1 Tax=Vagococcus hydrophili TaxID=2714947 RepID=A0A6G8ARJ1_9ENTE|nr:helix-turn-helix transcriptional regulator [Vagococcus hydrophili]QIL47589.1 helix-turn-helix transcriptional regulator [Vagococcus hydrophili]
MEISQRLQHRRKEMELTQESVAEKIHVSRQTISNWETGRTLPDIKSLVMLSDIYDISLDKLLKEDGVMVDHLQKIAEENQFFKRFCLLLVINIVLIVSCMFVKNTTFLYFLFSLIGINSTGIFYLIVKKI